MKKIRVKLCDVEFVLPETVLDTRSDGSKCVYLNPKNTASIIKKFVKNKYPNVKCWASSEYFANGNAVNVYVSNVDGSPLTSTIYDTIESFATGMRSGRFNGMYDSFEYREDNPVTDVGTPIRFGTKYISIYNHAKYGTKEYDMNRN